MDQSTDEDPIWEEIRRDVAAAAEQEERLEALAQLLSLTLEQQVTVSGYS